MFRYGGKEYTVIANTLKCDASYTEFTWTEYTLFNINEGYMWLSEAGGHWALIHEIDEAPRKGHRTLDYEGTEYALFQKSKSNTLHAAGEFSTPPFRKGAKYEEYIAPPEMLSCETTESGVTWFHAVHISPAGIAEATGLKKSEMPSQTGVGAVQPFSSALSQVHTNYIVGGTIVLLFIIQIIFAGGDSRELCVVNSSQADPVTGKITSHLFTKESESAVELEYRSDVFGNWSEAEIELYNEETGESVGTLCGAEYYSGVDDGGTWTEGEQLTTTILSSVDAGTYRMIVKPNKGTANATGSNFNVTLSNKPAIASNLFVMILAVMILALIQYFRRRSFESSRWSSSDYNPYLIYDE